jgi:hypothetical protein
MTRKLSRKYSLSVVASCIAVLTLLIAAAVLAQTTGADQTSRKANAVLAPAGAFAPAQAERPLIPWTDGAGCFPVSRSQTKRQGPVPMDSNPPLFLPAVTYGSGELGNPTSVVIADVNGDGKPDIVVANECADSCDFGGAVGVLLGNGDGTFQTAVTYLTGVDESSVAVADVNGDGHPDLVVANANGVDVLLGNGDGTFQTAVAYRSGGSSVAVADVNGDGHPDLVVAAANGVDVLLGNGDGTFQTAVTYGSGGAGPQSVAVADVSRDGKPDLLVANWGSNSVGVLLNNGDGTFQTAVTYGSGGENPYSVAVADVNGDGHPDLVVAAANGVDVLLGNGGGTFQTAVPYGSGGYGATSVVVADVNGDGKRDLVAANWCMGQCVQGHSGVGVLLGNGDGTFQTAVTYTLSGWDSWSVAVADVNGDGKPDLVVTMGTNIWGVVGVMLHVGDIPTTTAVSSSINPSVFGQAVPLTAVVSSSSGTPTGTVDFFDGSTALGNAPLVNGSATLSISSLAAGSHSITAVYQGSLKFNSSASAPLNQVVNTASTKTSLASSSNPVLINMRVKYTATVAGQYGGTATGTVRFQDAGVTIATVTLPSNQAAYSTSYITRGTHAMTATYSGDGNNAGSMSATLTEQVKGFPSKTVVTTSGSPSFVGQPVTFTATATSIYGAIPNGELVTFYDGTTAIGTGATASDVATFTTSSLTVGTHSIKATYAGDATFEPSTGSVKQVVDKYPTTAALSSSLNPSNYGQAVTFTATVTPTGPYPLTGNVTFRDGTLGIGSATLSGGVATITKSKLAVGTHSITATYNGDAFNGKSALAAITQTVTQAAVRMVLTSTPNPSTFGASVKFMARLTSNGGLPIGQPVTFSYDGATLGTANVTSAGVATFSTITLPRGSDTVMAVYAGNVDYSSASATVTQVVN